MKIRFVMMLAALMMSGFAMAQDGSFHAEVSPYCDGAPEFEIAGAKFDIREGEYAPAVAEGFCLKYSVTEAVRLPCSKNISSFTWTCLPEGAKYSFTCTSGKCVTKDGSRELQIEEGCTDSYTYSYSGNKTEVRYVGPNSK